MRAIAVLNNPNILIITETWTNKSVADDFLSIGGYDIIEGKDRNHTPRRNRSTHISFYKHQVYKHNQAEIIDILNTLLNTSQPQTFGYFSCKSSPFVDLIKKSQI